MFKSSISIAAAGIAFLASPLAAADVFAEYLWEKRPIVVFADSAEDPRFIRQMEIFDKEPELLEALDIIVLTDTMAGEETDLRLALRPRGFQLALIGKDGKVKLRKSRPWTVRELSRVIDKMPLRQQEIRQQRGLDDRN